MAKASLVRGQEAIHPSPHPMTHHMPPAGQRDEDVAAFMDQQLAVDAPVALPRETPYPFAALATVRSLQTGEQQLSGPAGPFLEPMPHTRVWMRTRAADSEGTTPWLIQKVWRGAWHFLPGCGPREAPFLGSREGQEQ